jgi:membrane-associated phospholipid phosphatase
MFVGLHVIELYGKFYVDHPPPPEFMLRTEYPIDFPLFHVRSEFSYPSGHSGRTVFLASILICLILASGFSKPVKYGLIGCIAGFTFVMLLSRPYLGEHWTTDVIGGALLGASLGIFSAVFMDKKFSLKKLLKTISKS